MTCCPHCFGCPGYNLLSEPLCLLHDLQFSPSPPEWPDHSCSLTAASHFTFPSPLLLLLSLSLLHLRKYLPYSEYFQFFFPGIAKFNYPNPGKRNKPSLLCSYTYRKINLLDNSRGWSGESQKGTGSKKPSGTLKKIMSR